MADVSAPSVKILSLCADLPGREIYLSTGPDTAAPASFWPISRWRTTPVPDSPTGTQTTLAGFDFPRYEALAQRKRPRTKDQIIEMLSSSGEKGRMLQGLTDISSPTGADARA